MDFTETPHAEDFMLELSDLVQEYINRGIKPKTIKWVFEIVSDDMPKKVGREVGVEMYHEMVEDKMARLAKEGNE